MSKLKDFADLVAAFGLGGTVIILIVLYLFYNPPIVFKILSFLASLGYKLFGIWKKAAIARQIETHINSGIHQLGLESPAAFSRALKLVWISNKEEYAILEEGTVVVRVRDDPNSVKPLVNATLLYLQEGVITESRPYIESRLLSAVDLVLAQRILVNSPQRGAFNYLTTNYLEPAIKDDRIAYYYEIADLIDRSGLLTRIVLRELSGLATKLTGKRPTSATRKESVNFLEFVGRVTGRKAEIPLNFFGRYLRCTVALLAKSETYNRAGLVPYQRNFRHDIDIGMHVIYLLSRGTKNARVGRHLAKWAVDEGLISGFIFDRFMQPDESGELIPGECIVCLSSRVGRSIQISPLEEAQILISQYIPESLTGEVDILSLAREAGKLTKVLVYSESHRNPVGICAGNGHERTKLISQALGEDERIDFIPWSPDPRKNVIAALVPLDENDVINVWIAPDSLNAKVIVGNLAAANRAVGTDAVNLKTAQRLLNMHIDLETQAPSISPEEELSKVLARRIPEVQEGKIEIVQVARRVGRIAKVSVRSKSTEVTDLLKVCIGPEAKTARVISQDLGGEQITFVIWDPENLERCVRQSLYPLQNKDIMSVSIEADIRKAIILVCDGKARRQAVGKDGDNVRLAERICNLKIEIQQYTQ